MKLTGRGRGLGPESIQPRMPWRCSSKSRRRKNTAMWIY